MRNQGFIPLATIQRLPRYLNYLYALREEAAEYVSSVALAEHFHETAIVVKKDLALVSKTCGKPKLGFKLPELIADIEEFLGYHTTKDAILAGAGRLGRTLLSYEGFKSYGLNIVAAIDTDPKVIGQIVNGKKVFEPAQLGKLADRLKVSLGIITVPAVYAQGVCDEMVAAGIRGIWNFAPVHLNVPAGVVVKDENMAQSLAVLSKQLDGLPEQTGDPQLDTISTKTANRTRPTPASGNKDL